MRNLKFEGILLKAGMRQSSSLSTCHVNTVLDAVGAATRQKKEAKYITRKRRSQMKISLGAQEFYQEISRSDFKKKKKTFYSNVPGYRINLEKSMVFLYTN